MADFPGKVNTETSSPQPQSRNVQLMRVSTDTGFIKSIPGILLLVETVSGLLVWTIVCSSVQSLLAAYGWVLFVSVTLWVLSVLLFIMLCLGIRQKFTYVPWPLVLLVFYVVATVLYFTAFLTNAITVSNYRRGTYAYNSLAAAAFFGIVVTLTYSASAVFAFLDWNGNRGSAGTSTVPV